MPDMIMDNVPTILTMLTVLAGFLGIGSKVKKVFKVFTEFFDVTRVVADFLSKVEKYGEDKKWTQDEIDDLVVETNRFKKEWKEVLAAIKELTAKSV